MRDVDLMLREFASFLEEELPAPDPECLVDSEPVSARSPRQAGLRRPVTVVVTAALAVLTVVGGGLLLVAGGDGLDTTPQSPMTTEAPPTTTETSPDALGWPWWRGGVYESPGYSCGPRPEDGCDGEFPLNVTQIWIGFEEHFSPGETSEDDHDYVDFFMTPAGDERPEWSPASGVTPLDPTDYLLGVPEHVPVELGHGVRISPLREPPAGLEVAGQAWLELTVSSVSATTYASRPPNERPSLRHFSVPTEAEPVKLIPSDGTTEMIEEVVLVASTDTMMQWIIALNQPGDYLYRTTYWGSGDIPVFHMQIRTQ